MFCDFILFYLIILIRLNLFVFIYLELLKVNKFFVGLKIFFEVIICNVEIK